MNHRITVDKTINSRKESTLMNKRVRNVLKGVAGVGVVFGGANSMIDTDVVYATELQTTELLEEDVRELEQGSASTFEREVSFQVDDEMDSAANKEDKKAEKEEKSE